MPTSKITEQEALDVLKKLGYEPPLLLNKPDFNTLNIEDVQCPRCGLQQFAIESIGWRTPGYKYRTQTAFFVCSNERHRIGPEEHVMPTLDRYDNRGCGHYWKLTYRNLGNRVLSKTETP